MPPSHHMVLRWQLTHSRTLCPAKVAGISHLVSDPCALGSRYPLYAGSRLPFQRFWPPVFPAPGIIDSANSLPIRIELLKFQDPYTTAYRPAEPKLLLAVSLSIANDRGRPFVNVIPHAETTRRPLHAFAGRAHLPLSDPLILELPKSGRGQGSPAQQFQQGKSSRNRLDLAKPELRLI